MCFYVFRKVGKYECKWDFTGVLQIKYQKNAKQITAPLKDGNTLRFTFGDNYLEALVTKGDKIVEGKGKYARKGIAVTEVFKMAESFKPHIKEGFDFLKEFKAAILK